MPSVHIRQRPVRGIWPMETRSQVDPPSSSAHLDRQAGLSGPQADSHQLCKCEPLRHGNCQCGNRDAHTLALQIESTRSGPSVPGTLDTEWHVHQRLRKRTAQDASSRIPTSSCGRADIEIPATPRAPAPCHGSNHKSVREPTGTEVERSEFAIFFEQYTLDAPLMFAARAVLTYEALKIGPSCRLWFFVPSVNRSLHVVSSADLLSLSARLRVLFSDAIALHHCLRKCVTAHQSHTDFISVSSVVAEQRGWNQRCLVVIDVSWAHDELAVCS